MFVIFFAEFTQLNVSDKSLEHEFNDPDLQLVT